VLRYLTHRLVEAALVLLGMSLLIYLLLWLMPGDPIDLLASGDPNITSEDTARLKAAYGLDRPLLERYGHWLARCGATSATRGYTRGRCSRSCCRALATPACSWA
jgi:peptide/nickel transport system permease protein